MFLFMSTVQSSWCFRKSNVTILDLFVDTFIRLSFHSNSHTSVIQKKRCTIIMFTMQKPFYFQSSKHQMCFRLNCSFPCGSSGCWLLLSNIIETHRCILCMPRFYRTNPSDAIATLEFRRRQNKNKIFQVWFMLDDFSIKLLHFPLFFLHKRKRKWK